MVRRRSRLQQSRQARRTDRLGVDPAASIQLAGFVAMVLVVIAVAAGFQGERFASAIARALGALGPLAEPVVFGASWLEIAAGFAVLAVIAATVWRTLRR